MKKKENIIIRKVLRDCNNKKTILLAGDVMLFNEEASTLGIFRLGTKSPLYFKDNVLLPVGGVNKALFLDLVRLISYLTGLEAEEIEGCTSSCLEFQFNL